MPTEEEKRQEQFLLLLLALARASERKINDGVRRRLVSVMRRIRRLVQQMSPTGQFRVFEWSRIKPQVLPLLEEITRTLRFYLIPEIQRLIPDVQDAAFDFVKGMNPRRLSYDQRRKRRSRTQRPPAALRLWRRCWGLLRSTATRSRWPRISTPWSRRPFFSTKARRRSATRSSK